VPHHHRYVLLSAAEMSVEIPDVVVDADDNARMTSTIGDSSQDFVDGNALIVQHPAARLSSVTVSIPLNTKINDGKLVSRTSLLDRVAGREGLSSSWPTQLTVMSGWRSIGKSVANVRYNPSCIDGHDNNCVTQSFDRPRIRDPLSPFSAAALPSTKNSETALTVAEVSIRPTRPDKLTSVDVPLSAVAAVDRSTTSMTSSVDDQRHVITNVRRLSKSKIVSSNIERGHVKRFDENSGVVLNVGSSPRTSVEKDFDEVDRSYSKSSSSVVVAVDTIPVLAAGLEKRMVEDLDGSSAIDGSGGNYETCVAVAKDKKRCYDRFLKNFARFSANSGNKFVGR